MDWAPPTNKTLTILVPFLPASTAPSFQGASPSLLWPNLIDALYALLRAFSDPQHLGMSHQWVYGALRDDQVCAALGEEVTRKGREREGEGGGGEMLRSI